MNEFGKKGSYFQLFLVSLFNFFLGMKDLTVHFLMGFWVEFLQ